MVTIYDIAKKTGFSPTTVSKALNNYPDISEKTKKIIINAAKEMGYTGNISAKSLKTKKSWLVGMLIEEELEVGPFFSRIIESFRKEMETSGYDVIYVTKTIGGKRVSYYDHCLYRNIEGILILSINENDKEIMELINNSKIPIITTDNKLEGVASVSSDNYEGAKIAVEYLYSLGHKKIAVLMGPQNKVVGRERFYGYIDTIKKLGLDIKKEWMIECDKFNFQAGYRGMKKLLTCRELPTGIVAQSDLAAFGAIVAACESGFAIPRDFSIVGFDDIEFSQYYNPSLTTIRQKQDVIGKIAAQQLIRMIDGDIEHIDIRIPVELVIRDSCRKIN